MGLYEVNDEFYSYFAKEIEAERGSWVFVIRLGKILGTNLTCFPQWGDPNWGLGLQADGIE